MMNLPDPWAMDMREYETAIHGERREPVATTCPLCERVALTFRRSEYHDALICVPCWKGFHS